MKQLSRSEVASVRLGEPRDLELKLFQPAERMNLHLNYCGSATNAAHLDAW